MDNFFPNNDQLNETVDKVKNGTISKILEGKDLLKPSLEYLLDNKRDIIDVDSVNSTTNEIWSHLKPSQKNYLMKLADRINEYRNYDTLNLIFQINGPQKANTPFGNSFYNGDSFSDDKSFESLVLPLGMDYGASFNNLLFQFSD
ncbi:unnamed protein product [Rhizophagus irregularis]|uniref:Uncharacterized protein n=1 Tax=Rhizophagus irregularis TaxID=588596 RepID=A0A2I1H684_9GLOM|nr:hypothetical protein RhiirA4_548187 [Rhizophagus irregularis]CAB4440405.1 unnamed protein product [Rhizophagus irregularis]CAB4440475.1 unnamed protein product [Rhizophagus irregularis]